MSESGISANPPPDRGDGIVAGRPNPSHAIVAQAGLLSNSGEATPTRVRLGVLGFMCSLSLLTYLDRICIMRVAPDIGSDLGLEKTDIGYVFSAFLLGYTLFEVPAGMMGDAWGSRRVITRIVIWWSIFTALTGYIASSYTLPSGSTLVVANAVIWLVLVRFLFGCGEAGAYPNLTRISGLWFPFRERALSQGAVWMSARLGGAIAPLVIGRLTDLVGWRGAFWILGSVGLVWAVGFFSWFRDTPEQKPECNEAERELIRASPYAWQQRPSGHGWPPWNKILLNSSVVALCIAGFGVSFGWYLMPTWQPLFLEEQFGIKYQDSEILTGLPFLCGAFGALIGGKVSDLLIEKTGSRRWGRSLVGFVCFGLAGICISLVGWTTVAWQAVFLLCLASFINDMAIPPIWAAAADIGGHYAGTMAGIMNMCGGVGGFITPILIPHLLGFHFGWHVIFSILASAWFIAATAWLFVDAGKPISAPGAAH